MLRVCEWIGIPKEVIELNLPTDEQMEDQT